MLRIKRMLKLFDETTVDSLKCKSKLKQLKIRAAE